MAERFGNPPGVMQGDIGARYTRKRLGDEVYVGHYIKAGDRIRVRATILTGVIASLTTVNLTVGGRVQGMDGELVPFGDSFTFSADGVQTARYFLAPEGYVIDLIVESTSTGLTSGDLTVIVDIMQGVGSSAVAVGLLAYGYVYPAGLLGLNVSRNIGGGSGGGMAIGGTVTSGATGSVLFIGSGPVLAQDNAAFFYDDANNRLRIGAIYSDFADTGFGVGVMVGGDDVGGSGATLYLMSDSNDANTPQIKTISSQGTLASPAANADGDQLFLLQCDGYTTTPARSDAVALRITVDGSPSASATPGRFGFFTRTAADGAMRERLRVTAATTASVSAPSANTSVAVGGQLEVQSSVVLHKGVTFANLPASPVAGMVAYITDSNAFLWGATIAGGSTNKVLGFYNGTNWTVAGA